MTEAIGLTGEHVPIETQPTKIGLDRSRVLGARAGHIGVVHAQQKLAAVGARKQPIDQRDAGVAEVQLAGRRRRETGEDSTHDLLGGFGVSADAPEKALTIG